MDPRDFDDFMRRVVDRLERYEERISALERLEALGVPAWDDIQVSISQLRIPPSSAPTWRTWNYGIGGGVAFSVLGWGVGNYADLFIQSSHSMKLETALDYHIHWSIPSNSAGSKFRFQVDAIAAGIDGSFAVVSGSPFAAEFTLDGSESGKHKYFDLAEIPGVNTTVSSAYILRLTRIAATSLEYAPEVYTIFSDAHYEIDSLGSRLPNAK